MNYNYDVIVLVNFQNSMQRENEKKPSSFRVHNISYFLGLKTFLLLVKITVSKVNDLI